MITLKHDRIIPLGRLSYYSASEWLDVTLYLPWSKDTRRRVWLMIPESSPAISIDDVRLNPLHVSSQQPRWIDYGTEELPIRPENWYRGEFHQLRVRGMKVSESLTSYLVITTQLDLSLEGYGIEQVERKLWGLARCDAGATTLQPACLSAGSAANFIVKYTAGPKGLPPGALVRFNIDRVFTEPQVNDPLAPGFVSVACADNQVSIAGIAERWAGGTGIICRLESELASGFSVNYNTDSGYIFPCKLNETERHYPYTPLPPLSAEVAFSEDFPFVSLAETNGHTFEVIAGPSERLHLFLPGRRYTSECVNLRGTFTDHFRNSPPLGPIDADIELRLISGAEETPLGTPAEHFVARHRFEIALPRLAPGVYRAVAFRTDTRDEVARSNPLEIIGESDGRDRLYWGEIHAHTEMSDGSGDFSELYRHAHEEGCLDFSAASDHAEFFSDNQWLWMQDVTNAHNQPGRFVTLVGYETEPNQRDRNVYTSRPRLKLFRGRYPPTSSLDLIWEHFRGDEEVVAGVHALLAHGISWDHWLQHDPSVERFLEVYSMWGANDFRDNPLIPDWIPQWVSQGLIKPGMTANELLQKGPKLGFTGGGDCHCGRCGFAPEDPDGQGTRPHGFSPFIRYRCGMTAAVMPRLDRISLIQAIRTRRTYATTGARILLDFTAGGFPMGSAGVAEEVVCCATVHAVEPIGLIEIVKDGSVVWSEELDSLDAAITWRDPAPRSGEHYYYLHVVQVDGQMAWSSPIWIGLPVGQ